MTNDKSFLFFLQIQAEPGLRSKKHKAFIGLCAEARLCLDLQKKLRMLCLLVINTSWDI